MSVQQIKKSSVTDTIVEYIKENKVGLHEYVKTNKNTSINIATIKKALYVKSRECEGSEKEFYYSAGIHLNPTNFLDIFKKLDGFNYKKISGEDRASSEITIESNNPIVIDDSSIESIENHLKSKRYIVSKNNNPLKYIIYVNNKQEFNQNKDDIMMCKHALSKFNVEMQIISMNNFTYADRMTDYEKKELAAIFRAY